MLTVRKVVESDKPLLMAAADADPYHKAAGLTGEHWAGPDSIFYEDETGPVVALRKRVVWRIDIQFLTGDKFRNAKAIEEGFYRMMQIAISQHVTEVIFNTESPEVAHFFSRRFHFKEVSKGTYSLCLG